MGIRAWGVGVVWIEHSESNKIYGGVMDSGGAPAYYGYSTPVTIDLNTPTFLAFTVVPGGTSTFYKNGVVAVSGSTAATLRSGNGITLNDETDTTNHAEAFKAILPWAMSPGEIQELAHNPWQLFAPQSSPTFYSLPAAGSSGAPTLSLPGVQSITASGATPKVTLTFA